MCVPGLAGQLPLKKAIAVVSPDGKVRAELTVTDGVLSYRVTADGKQVLGASKIGIEADDVELGQGVTLGAARVRRIDEHYRFLGAHATATNRANEAVIPAQSHGESYFVDVHVANDGVAVRLRLPAKQGRKIQADRSSWALEGNPTMWVDKLDFGYRSPYHATTLKGLGMDRAAWFSLTAQVGDLYVTLTRSGGEGLWRTGGEGECGWRIGRPAARRSEGMDYEDDAVTQPWRVTIITRNLTDLVNTTLVQNLNPPG